MRIPWRIYGYVFLLVSVFPLLVIGPESATGASKPAVATLEAERMNLPRASGKVVSDAAASGRRALLVRSNATALGRKSVPRGSRASKVILRVKANQCKGSPQMMVKIDGRRVIRKRVRQKGYTNYAARVNLAGGVHRVQITMRHDYQRSANCDRNLRLDKVTFLVHEVASPSTDPLPAPVANSNPFAGTKLYVNPNSSAKKQAEEWRLTRPQDARQMDKVTAQPTADWFGDWNGDVRDAVDKRVTAANRTGAMPVLVAYNIPKRDCGSYSGGGAPSPEAYRTWVRAFAAGIGRRKAAVILEPDAVALSYCLSPSELKARLGLIKDAVGVLKSRSKVAVYVDAGHSNWIGATEMAGRLKRAGVAGANGFSLNVSNFQPTADNVGYGQKVSSLIGGKHFVIDTSRNGRGPDPRNEWCNPSGRALGDKPGVARHPLVDAYLWIKPPGESDGTCNGGPPAGQWWADYALGLAQRAAY